MRNTDNTRGNEEETNTNQPANLLFLRPLHTPSSLIRARVGVGVAHFRDYFRSSIGVSASIIQSEPDHAVWCNIMLCQYESLIPSSTITDNSFV